MTGWWDTDLYVTPDPQSVREAEEREARDRQSCVVRHAAPDYRGFWSKIDEKLAERGYNKRGARVVEHPRASHHTLTA